MATIESANHILGAICVTAARREDSGPSVFIEPVGPCRNLRAALDATISCLPSNSSLTLDLKTVATASIRELVPSLLQIAKQGVQVSVVVTPEVWASLKPLNLFGTGGGSVSRYGLTAIVQQPHDTEDVHEADPSLTGELLRTIHQRLFDGRTQDPLDGNTAASKMSSAKSPFQGLQAPSRQGALFEVIEETDRVLIKAREAVSFSDQHAEALKAALRDISGESIARRRVVLDISSVESLSSSAGWQLMMCAKTLNSEGRSQLVVWCSSHTAKSHPALAKPSPLLQVEVDGSPN